MFAGNFAPAGWLFCDGRPLPISENETLFILIGTTFGGDGQETFNLPNLQSRVPIHQGNGFILGQTGGVESVTLTVNQIPGHTHPAVATTTTASQASASTNVLAATTTMDLYRAGNPTAVANAQTIGPVGGSQPHENLQPYLALNFIISQFGLFPHT